MLVLDQHHVMPVISEVIHIVEAARIHPKSFLQHDFALIDVLQFFVEIRIGFAVADAADDEFMQVTVGPAKRSLKYKMQLRQLDGFGHDETAPNRRNHVEQFDF